MQDNEDELELQESDLTVEELQAFKQAAATGKLAELVQLWVPWWSLPEAAGVQLSSSGTSKVIAQDTSGKNNLCYALQLSTVTCKKYPANGMHKCVPHSLQILAGHFKQSAMPKSL